MVEKDLYNFLMNGEFDIEIFKRSAQIFKISKRDENTWASIVDCVLTKLKKTNGIFKKDWYELLAELIKEMTTKKIVDLFHQRIKPEILTDIINDENDLDFLKKLCIIYKEKVVCKQKN